MLPYIFVDHKEQAHPERELKYDIPVSKGEKGCKYTYQECEIQKPARRVWNFEEVNCDICIQAL
jgi:hypothetical protein